MAKVEMMWLNDGMRGRADKTSRTYTKVNKVTGRTYAITLRNPRYGKALANPKSLVERTKGLLTPCHLLAKSLPRVYLPRYYKAVHS